MMSPDSDDVRDLDLATSPMPSPQPTQSILIGFG